MQRHQQIISAAIAALLWAGWANAAPPPEPDIDIADAGNERPAPAIWIPVEARNHASDAHGLAAVVLGVARERGMSRLASLRVDCFDGSTTVRLDADGFSPGPWAVEVRHSLDGGRFVTGSWRPSADRSSLELSAAPAIQFVSELYGKTELRIAVLRPLSVPFLLTFAVAGAEPALSRLADRCHWSIGPAISDAGR